GQLMMLPDVIAVLVEGDRRDAVQRRNPFVIGDPCYRIAQLPIMTYDLFVWLLAVGQSAPGAAVSVEVGALPSSLQARVRVEEVCTCENRRLRKPVQRP